MSNTTLKIAVDDGSTNVKVSWLNQEGGIETLVSPNSFRKDWKSAALRKDKRVFNYQIDGSKYTYDATSDKSLETTHVDYQYDDLNLLAVHHALLQTGMEPSEVKLVVTLPITEYYHFEDCQKNEENIERKRQNLMRDISLNRGETFKVIDVEVMPESLPAVLSTLVNSNCNEFTRSLVIDLGGTTLDMGIVVGEFDDVSAIYGNNEIGVSMVTNTVRKALAFADSDSSYLVANELIRNRYDDTFVSEVVNDESQIDMIRDKMDAKINELAKQVVTEAKKFAKNPNRVYLVGGGASLIYPAVKAAYPALKERVYLVENAQAALAQEMCLYHADEEETQGFDEAYVDTGIVNDE